MSITSINIIPPIVILVITAPFPSRPLLIKHRRHHHLHGRNCSQDFEWHQPGHLISYGALVLLRMERSGSQQRVVELVRSSTHGISDHAFLDDGSVVVFGSAFGGVNGRNHVHDHHHVLVDAVWAAVSQLSARCIFCGRRLWVDGQLLPPMLP